MKREFKHDLENIFEASGVTEEEYEKFRKEYEKFRKLMSEASDASPDTKSSFIELLVPLLIATDYRVIAMLMLR
jgi:hypothetical protein